MDVLLLRISCFSGSHGIWHFGFHDFLVMMAKVGSPFAMYVFVAVIAPAAAGGWYGQYSPLR